MASTIRNGAFSPPLSSATSYTTGMHSRLNVVSRLAIEGKAKQGEGANFRLFLKLTIPVDLVTPGQIIPLFPENDVKLGGYQVHPLDASSVPYNFSSSAFPLLHDTARALNLPARSTKSYLSLFDIAPGSMSSGTSSSTSKSVVPQFEERYTGYVLISLYNVCFVLPKEFPPKYRLSATTDSDGEGMTSRSGSKIPFKSRRGSIGERNSLQFMVGLELSVPYTTKPPRAPYLVSIPIPRCLSNTVKVRIFQPKPMSTSFQSLSSDDEPTGWELATEPLVTRAASKLSRSTTYMNFADDESSESSMAGTADNCIIHGTFTSSDYLRIRWATPLKDQETPSDGRRRVGVKDVEGNLTCTILEKTVDGGVRMRLDYQGTCTGVWFPGVATMLGMDVLLDKRGSHCNWSDDSTGQWSVDGEDAFTGFSIGPTMPPVLSRESSLETPQLTITGLPQGLGSDRGSPTPSRASSISSSSLLRAPLPQRVSTPEYSFEDSSTPTTPGMMSSVAYTHSSNGEFGLSAQAGQLLEPPTQQITVHINLNELQPYPKNKFVFNISGTVVTSPSLAESDVMTDPDSIPIALPSFCVQRAESQLTSVTVRSLCEDSAVEVVPGTSVSQFQFGKKMVLQTGSQTKCGAEGGMILVKPSSPKLVLNHLSRTISQTPRTPATTVTATETSMILDRSVRSAIYRDGPLVIPWAEADVIPHPATSRDEWSYSVKLILPTPVEAPSEWLEFGLAMPPPRYTSRITASISTREPPHVSIACASVEGVPVRFETFGQLKHELEPFAPMVNEDESKRKWLTWIRVHCGPGRHGILRVDYSLGGRVLDVVDKKGKKRDKEGDDMDVNVFLPMFSLPVASYDVMIKKLGASTRYDTNIPIVSEEEDHFHNHDVEPFTYQHLTMKLSRPPFFSRTRSAQRFAARTLSKIASIAPTIAILFLLIQVVQLRLANERVEQQLESLVHGRFVPNATDTVPLPSTSSAATDVSSSDRWWYGGGGMTHTLVVPTSSHTSLHTPLSSSSSSASTPLSFPPDTSENTGDDEDESDLPPPLIPAIYVPISWILHQRVQFEQVRQQVTSGWAKVWRFVEIVLNWPLGPGE